MNIKDIAKQARLKNTATRIDGLLQRRNDEANRSTNLVSFQGFDKNRGKFYGTKPDGSVAYFDLETSATPRIGQRIEVAIAANILYGKGDLRPLK
jgi:hypothetical protein